MQSKIFQAFICYNFDDYGLQLMKTQTQKAQKVGKDVIGTLGHW